MRPPHRNVTRLFDFHAVMKSSIRKPRNSSNRSKKSASPAEKPAKENVIVSDDEKATSLFEIVVDIGKDIGHILIEKVQELFKDTDKNSWVIDNQIAQRDGAEIDKILELDGESALVTWKEKPIREAQWIIFKRGRPSDQLYAAKQREKGLVAIWDDLVKHYGKEASEMFKKPSRSANLGSVYAAIKEAEKSLFESANVTLQYWSLKTKLDIPNFKYTNEITFSDDAKKQWDLIEQENRKKANLFCDSCHYQKHPGRRCGVQKNDYAFCVFFHPQKQWTLRALEEIPSNSVIGTFAGLVITEDEAYDGRPTHHQVRVDNLYIDAMGQGNELRFLSHSCDPNIHISTYYRLGGFPQLVFKTKKNISPGEELCFDYHPDDDAELPANGRWIKCQCASANCRGWMGSERRSLDGLLHVISLMNS